MEKSISNSTIAHNIGELLQSAHQGFVDENTAIVERAQESRNLIRFTTKRIYENVCKCLKSESDKKFLTEIPVKGLVGGTTLLETLVRTSYSIPLQTTQESVLLLYLEDIREHYTRITFREIAQIISKANTDLCTFARISIQQQQQFTETGGILFSFKLLDALS